MAALVFRTVRRKLLFVVLATTLAALVVSGAALLVYELRSYERSFVTDIEAQADLIGRASAPSLIFEDPTAARQNLALLQAQPKIAAAAIYKAKGGVFAAYQPRGASQALPNLPQADGYRINGKELVLVRRIVENNEILGSVYINAHYDLWERLKNYLAILAAVTGLSLAVAGAVSSWMQRAVTVPIMAISEVAHQVMERRDFSLRAEKTTEDEIGYLVDAFNDMLAEVGRRAENLETSNRSLEREVNERREVEEALRTSERRQRTLIAASTSVVWTADGKGGFCEVQDSWRQYTGQDQQTYSGTGWRSALDDAGRAALDLAWARAVSDPAPFQLEVMLWHEQSQRRRFVTLRAVPVMEAGHDVREWIGTITDIDDQRLAEKDLRELNADLEQRVSDRTREMEAANRELESFSYSVSHDLRAPVRAVAGFTRLLSEEHGTQLDDEGRRKLSIIQAEAARMGVLIDELLAFSRLGRKAIQKTELDMRDLAQRTLERLQSQHEGTAAEVRLGSLPRAQADRVLLEQVWANFVSNALKFSSKRERPVVEVGAISDEKEHTYFVRDNGAGFDPKYQSKLFGVFQRLHSASEYPGTGVGLALVHRIITRHGGRVWADSAPGEGATFYFTLPKETADGTV